MDSLLLIENQRPLFYPEQESTFEPPALSDVVEYDLGNVKGVNLTFTGSTSAFLAVQQDFENTRFVYIAGAEASPDATRDGVVVGTAMGIVRAVDYKSETRTDYEVGRYNFLTYPNGTKFFHKTEGVTIPPGRLGLLQKQKASIALTVLDMDDPDVASQMCVVRIHQSVI